MFSSAGSNHPIIPKQSDLYLTANYVTFHSDDRDETKYPTSSQWATRLPQNINNIRSMHLEDCYIPTRHLYVFKNDYQNLAFMVRVKNGEECEFDPNTLFQNCTQEPKCTPRLNLSRPLVPHSNVKFNELTKDKYVEKDLLGNVINYQLPTTQLQDSFSAPQNCTSYQNNLDGLNNMQNNKCENKVICNNNVEPNNVEPNNICDCISISTTDENSINPNFNYTPGDYITYLDCCGINQKLILNNTRLFNIHCVKTYKKTLPPFFNGHTVSFSYVSVLTNNTYVYELSLTNCGQNVAGDGNIDIRITDQNGANVTLSDAPYWRAGEPDKTRFTINNVNNPNCPCTKECDIWAPRSMCDQETALLRVNGTVPPYIRQMRENEDRVQKGEQPMEFNYDGCNAFCNPNNFSDCDYFMIRIKEGVYTGKELASVLQEELQRTIFGGPSPSGTWKVYFSEVNCRMYFYLEKKEKELPKIEFRFDWKINYQCQNFHNKNQPEVWYNKHWWGLGDYLGFDKQKYSFHETSWEDILKSQINNCPPSPTPPPSPYLPETDASTNENYLLKPPDYMTMTEFTAGTVEKSVIGLVSCRCVNLEGPSVLYMEVEKYNNCDEITPGPSNTNSTYNNTFAGKTKTIFAKISLKNDSTGHFKHESRYITTMKNFLEERINKLEFKFRYHDGRYVYFGNNKDLNFTIQFNCAEPNTLNNVTFSAVPGWSSS